MSDILFFYMLIPIVSLAINVVDQILTFRLLKQVGMLRSIFIGLFSGFVTLLALHIFLILLLKNTAVELLITNILIYLALGYCYFHFINLGETARRIRILNEIYYSDGGLTVENILKRYNADTIIDARLKRLLANNQLSSVDNKFFIKNSLMLHITKVMVFMKLIVIGKESEFD